MNVKHFYVVLLAFNLSVHLLRFPHLILENGGGAYLILFFIALNFLTLPLLITERIVDEKLRKIDVRSLIMINKQTTMSRLDQAFVSTWFGTRALVNLSFFWFFLYLGSSCLIYFFYFFKSSLFLGEAVTDVPSLPDMEFRFLVPVVWTVLCFGVFLKYYRNFVRIFSRWVLPCCLMIMFALFLKVIVLVNNYEGLKILFYPDFSALTPHSLLTIVGHSVASLFVGIGFYDLVFKRGDSEDSIESLIHSVILSILVAIVVGVMALPMIEQVSESPFGSSWVFHILPRWVSYGDFGPYYCSLFFLVFGLLCFFISVVLLYLSRLNFNILLKVKRGSLKERVGDTLFFMVSVFMVIFLQNRLIGWSGQSLLLTLDGIVIQGLIPILALVMVWFLFRHTKKQERMAVFTGQQIFYHNRVFFRIWEKVTLYFVPSIIILAWILRLFL